MNVHAAQCDAGSFACTPAHLFPLCVFQSADDLSVPETDKVKSSKTDLASYVCW
jgi:hypothetical protein